MRVELSQECSQGPSYAGIWGKVQSLCREWSGRGRLSGVERVQGEDVIKKVKGLMQPDTVEPCDSLRTLDFMLS